MFLLCSCSFIWAQQAPRFSIIAGITVAGESGAVDAETVVTLSGLRVGEEARPDNLVMAVRNLWNRHLWKDVRIEKDRETALGVFVVIRLEEFPRLRSMIITGNDDVNEMSIRKAVQKLSGEPFSQYDTYLIRSRIKKLYDKEGMMFAKVDVRADKSDSANTVDLYIDVKEGAEFHVRSITVEGNSFFSSSDVVGAFEDTKTKSWYEFWKSNKFDAVKYKEDKERLKKFFLSKGFLDAELISDTVTYEETFEVVDIRLSIKEGRQSYLRNVTFTGNTAYPSEVLIQRLRIEPGEVFDQEKFDRNLEINEDQSDAKSMYSDNGYLQARFVPELSRPVPDSVDVLVRVFEGERYTIRRIELVGNTKTRDKVIRRELFTRPGDYFNRSAIIRTVRALGVLNYFNPEALKPDVMPVDATHVDLQYKVEERSTDTFNASVGFAGAFGLTGSVGVTLNNFDITQPLKGGGGQVMSFQWEFGQASRLQTFQISFTEPWLFNQPTTVGFNLYDTKQNFNISVERTGAQLNVGRRFRFPDDYFRGDFSVGYERIVSNTASIFSRAGTNTALTLGATISRTSLDNMVFPTSGSKFIVSTRTTTGFLGVGTTDFFKLGITMDMVNPLININGNPRLVMFMGADLGYVDGIRNDTTMPPGELYYMGGNGLGGFAITPLRGYRDNSIGPLSASGQALGGRAMARFLLELRFALSLNPFPIYLLSFAEAGNVWANIRLVDPFGLKRAAGFGVRLMLQPIGLLGFDMGYGFDIDPFTNEKSGWRFHFQFGR